MQQALNCQKCNREIENLCSSCIEKELIDWRPTLAIEFSEKIEGFKDKARTSQPCKKCSNNVDVCVSCLYDYIYNWLQENNPELIEEFTAFFSIHK